MSKKVNWKSSAVVGCPFLVLVYCLVVGFVAVVKEVIVVNVLVLVVLVVVAVSCRSCHW